MNKFSLGFLIAAILLLIARYGTAATPVTYLFASDAYTVGSPNTATITITDNVTGPAQISLFFNGLLRDRVGQSTLAQTADGQMDGAFTLTLTEGGPRTLTQLKLTNSIGGVWDTAGGTGFWTLGVANGLDTALLNGSDDSVNLTSNTGDSLKLFAADFNGTEFLNDRVFTVTATFSDGSTATANVTVVQTFTLTVASANASAASIAVTPNDNNNQAGGTTPFTRVYNSNTAVTLTAAQTVAGNNFNSWTGCDSISGTTCNLTMTADRTVTAGYGVVTQPAISLGFNGLLRDKVGQSTLSRVADGQIDGAFTATLIADGPRMLTQLKLTNSIGGVWDTVGGTGFWTLGAANGQILRC